MNDAYYSVEPIDVAIFETDGPPMAYFELPRDGVIFEEPSGCPRVYRTVSVIADSAPAAICLLDAMLEQARTELKRVAAAIGCAQPWLLWRKRPSLDRLPDGTYRRSCRFVTVPALPEALWTRLETPEHPWRDALAAQLPADELPT